MATRRKQPARRRKPTSKRTGKRAWSSIALTTIFVGLVGVSVWLFWSGRAQKFLSEHELLYSADKPGVTVADWVEGILIAGGVDTDQQLQIVVRDEIERWKVTLGSKEQKRRIIHALRKGVKARGGSLEQGEELVRNGRPYHIIEMERENGEPLRLIFEIRKERAPVPKKKKTVKPKPKQVVAAVSPPDVGVKPTELVRPADGQRLIAVILDDIGHEDVSSLNLVLELKYPITFAVLPYLAHSKSCAYYFHQNQYEVMLHMPMEPESYPKADPGEGAIFSHLNDTEIRDALNSALRAVPYVTGVNNHMGSKITASRSLMRPVLTELKDRNLFYIDSRTQSNTIAFKMAGDLGLRTGRRDIFLDSEQSYEFAVHQMKEAKEVADRHGTAIVIGHPYKTSLRALAEVMPTLNEEGYRFVFASELVQTYSGHL